MWLKRRAMVRWHENTYAINEKDRRDLQNQASNDFDSLNVNLGEQVKKMTLINSVNKLL